MNHFAQEHSRVYLEFAGRRRELLPGASTMGRSHRCEVVLPDPSASRQHALISLEAGRVTVQDLGSSNGTLVNGRLTQGEVEITDGDLVLVGETEIQVRIIDVERSETMRLPALTRAAQTTRTFGRPDGAGLDEGHRDGPSRSEAVAVGEAMAVGEVLASPPASWDATGIISTPPEKRSPSSEASSDVARKPAGSSAETSFADISQELEPLSDPVPLPPLADDHPMAAPPSETIAVPSLPFPGRTAKEGRAPAGPASPPLPTAPRAADVKDPAARSQTLPIPKAPRPDETGEVLPSLAEIEERIGASPAPAPSTPVPGKGAGKLSQPSASRARSASPAAPGRRGAVAGLRAQAPSFAPAAGFWIRAGAYLLDGVWMALFAAIATFLAGGPESTLGPLVGSAVGLGLFFLVPVIGWTLKGTTPAKALLGLQVYDVDGNVGLPFGRSLLRWLGYLISAVPLFLGFFMVGWQASRRGLHDLIAGSYVGYGPGR